MVADSALPVWSIRPNWREPILERLSWLTDVIEASDGNEQRRALRLSPRRAFEITFNPVDAVRSYFDLFLHRLGAQEFMLPLFHDQARLGADIDAGDTVLAFDTSYREFEVGGMLILMSDDPFVFDKAEITAVDAASVTVEAAAIANDWPAGTRVFPLRRSRLSAETNFSAITPSRTGRARIRIEPSERLGRGRMDGT